MIEAAALVDAGELQFLDGVDDLLQVLRGQVQIPGCHLQILMAEQKLDGAQVGTGFEQMRGPAWRTRCGLTVLRRPAFLAASVHATPYGLVADGLLASRDACVRGTGRCAA